MKATIRALTLSLLFLAAAATAQNARIAEWVENAPASDNSKIALGYPVPIPVDTPLPFAGFRSYAGLHTRHQDLAATTPWALPVEIGQTRDGRTIWAYQLGDADHLTYSGLPEHAMLTSGGIHAREWQSPEVATGIIELLTVAEDDHHLVSYLRDNVNIIVIPVLNVDGFLQTQRFPSQNWLGSDPNDPQTWPRDGRMRRKNMLGTDEDLFTEEDHLFGVDLNRNNAPFWNTNPNSSSGSSVSLVYHGASTASEPETQALDAAAQLGPIGRLSMYTDLHSFSQEHRWGTNGNGRLNSLRQRLLDTFTGFHVNFDAAKNYVSRGSLDPNQGIGATDEYFTHSYQVLSWTLEIEPSSGRGYHAPLPGMGADYGGLGRNVHDGFILPDSEVPRVRTELAQTFAVAYYQQAGPPSIAAVRTTDIETGAVVFEAEWDMASATERELYSFQAQPLQLDRDYNFWLAFDKPMRWRSNGEAALLPGQPANSLDIDGAVVVDDTPLTTSFGDLGWAGSPGGSPDGYLRYLYDTLSADLYFPLNAINQGAVVGVVTANLQIGTFDMTSQQTDADPSTVARWENGAWSGYEDSNGDDGNDTGGTDSTVEFQITSDRLGDPFVIEPGTSSAWFDPSRTGEGFMLEILTDAVAVLYWFTYDSEGQQDWYIAVGEISGNRILFPELLRISGGSFGPGFDPENVTETAVGSATFIWSDCDTGAMDWQVSNEQGVDERGRMNLQRLSRVMGIDCGNVMLPPIREEALLSGSWYDPSHAGEGYTLEVLTDERVLVYWFSFDADGNRRWFFGIGEIRNGKLVFDEMLTTTGPEFGAGFDPADLEELPWGSLELDIDCEGGTASFMPVEQGFPEGVLSLTQLTSLDGLECTDPL
jgi:hypothetical protein